ncbi:hypothetical protein [Novosphingobium sp. PC22D]|uniref:hypothetical protein n=1 Tax=Novosphingobium sp. PC22D TaxID=1962403 RepID=UPI0014399516|nr:hypothetical protein [Novosphingobium sp. PC22D]
MIRADADKAFDALARRLAAKARRLAEAQTAERLASRKGDPARWRRARLLWPLFAKG